MSSNLHNEGKIPWNLLNDNLIIEFRPGKSPVYKFKNEDSIWYFCCEFRNCLKNFASTAKDDITDEHNPIKWRYGMHKGGGAQISYDTSLFLVYVMLNLTLLDYQKYQYVSDWTYQICLGESDYSHPEYLSNKFQKLVCFINSKYTIKELDNQVITDIKIYLKDVFKCLYNMVRINDTFLQEKSICRDLYWEFGLD